MAKPVAGEKNELFPNRADPVAMTAPNITDHFEPRSELTAALTTTGTIFSVPVKPLLFSVRFQPSARTGKRSNRDAGAGPASSVLDRKSVV